METPLKTVECPHCKHSNPSYFESKHLCCQQCGTIFQTDNPQVIYEQQSLHQQYEPWSFLTLHQTFTHNKVRYRIVGGMQVRGNCVVHGKDENGKPTTSSHNFSYQEWFCLGMNNNKKELIITEDKHGIKFSVPYNTENLQDPNTAEELQVFRKHAIAKNLSEHGNARVVYFVGETDQAFLVGQKFAYKFFQYKTSTYGVEWSDENDYSTYRYYKQTPRSKYLVKNQIAQENDISTYEKRMKEFDFLRGVFVLATIVSLIFLIVSFANKGNTFFRTQAPLAEIDEDGFLTSDTLVIENPNKAYKLTYGANLSAGNTEVYVATEVLNENTNVVNLFEHDFWKATGVEGGERWRESDVKESVYLTFDMPGKYRFVFHVEKTPKTRINNGDTVYISVADGVMMSRYWIPESVILLIVTILMYDYHTSIWLRRKYFKLLKI